MAEHSIADSLVTTIEAEHALCWPLGSTGPPPCWMTGVW